jgi:hypothetical protein
LVDGIWVSWNIGNGPNATVTVEDTYSYTGMTLRDLQPQDTLQNDWSVVNWTAVEAYTCQKVKSDGCDVLTAKVERPWH